MVSILGCAGEIGVGVENDVFREMDMGRMKRLVGLPVIVDCKNVFGDDSEVVYLGIGKGD